MDRCERTGALIGGPATGPATSVAKLNAIATFRNRHGSAELIRLKRRIDGQMPLTPEQLAVARELAATLSPRTGPAAAAARLTSMARHPSRAGRGGRAPMSTPPGMELAPGAKVYTENGRVIAVCPRGHRNSPKVE